MSKHSSFKDHRFSRHIIDRSHPGQRAASPRKRANQARRAILDEAEAIKLGISISELHVRRFQTTQAVLARQRAEEATAARRRQEEWDRRFGGGRGYYSYP